MNIVISGGSTIAEQLIKALSGKKHRFTIIEEEHETFMHLSEVLPQQVMLIEGDGCDPDVQRDAGVDVADLFIALMGHDEANFVACQIAKTACEVPRCIASLNSPKNEDVFKICGIEPVSITELIARAVEQEELIGAIRMAFSLQEGNIIMTEVKLPTKMKHKNGIRADQIPVHRDAQLISVIRDSDFVMINDDLVLMPGEKVVAAVKEKAEDEFRAAFKKL